MWEPGWLMCSLNENNMQVCGFEVAMLKPGADSREKKSHAAGLCSGPRVGEAYGSGRARRPRGLSGLGLRWACLGRFYKVLQDSK